MRVDIAELVDITITVISIIVTVISICQTAKISQQQNSNRSDKG